MRGWVSAALFAAACGSNSGVGPNDLGGGGGDGLAGGVSSARAFTDKLGAPHAGHFLVGMGNDGTNDGNDPAYGLGATIDLHYHYLVGLSADGGWPTWNSNPDYAGKRIAEARGRNVVPMFTFYAMASRGENDLAGSLGNAAYMQVWWKDYLQLLATVKAANTPVVIHVEPDYWGYLEQAALDRGGADKIPAQVAASQAAECAGLPETAAGFGRCIVRLTRMRAPLALLGFHASAWGSKMDVHLNTTPGFDVAGEAQKTVDFFKAVGGDETDFLAVDLIDRDAGCYEAGHLPMCPQRNNVYWDEGNAKLPHFHQSLAWTTALYAGLGKPILWWQLPFGTPSAIPGGVVGRFRDNRVHYIFGHLDEYVASGGVGAVWGTGAGDQTFMTGDDGQFTAAVVKYFQAPVALP